MKKLYFYILMMMPVFALTSCDTDEMIADKLTGANWEGWLDTYYSNRWGEEFKDGEYRTVWRFDAAYYDDYGTATYGTGYEVDYSTANRNEYAYSPFDWVVRNGDIYITYRNPDWNNVRIDYRDYTITHNHFRGTMYDWEDRIYDFDLENNASWDWGYYRYSYSRTRGAEADSSMPICYGEDGESIATGKFATALLNMKKASN